jgi:cytochrome c553
MTLLSLSLFELIFQFTGRLLMNNRANKNSLGLIVSSLMVFSVYADNQIKDAPSWSTPARGVNAESNEIVKNNDAVLFNIIGSKKVYSQQQIDDKFNAPDWFPSQNNKMPDIVKSGKKPTVWACASCHLASGTGHPESASLAGLDSQYLQAQMSAFADDTRLDYSGHMNRMAKALNKKEIKEISDWFSSLAPRKVTKVVETEHVLKTYVDDTRMRLVALPYKMEVLGNRIIEIPDNVAEVKKRHPESSFISYVPKGSLERGKKLVSTGNGRTVPCAGCHGTDLKGSPLAPAITGNFSIYTVRQLHGFKGGSRKGGKAIMMRGVVSSLTNQDIVDIAAYLTFLSVN